MTKKMTSKYIALLLFSCNCALSGTIPLHLSTSAEVLTQEQVRIIPYQGITTYTLSKGDSFTMNLLYYQGNYYGRTSISILDNSALMVRTLQDQYLFSEIQPCFMLDLQKIQGNYAQVQAVPEPATLALIGIGLFYLRSVPY